MNCPDCKKELPENYGDAYCPFCGKDLSSKAEPPQKLTPVKFRWRLFLCALLTPALLTLLSAATMRFLFLTQRTNEGVSPVIALVGGAIGGVICGVMLGSTSNNLLARIALSILMSAIMVIVCIMLCFFGCGVGGYQMRLN
jgi:uncharacterized protein YacL